MEKGITLVVWNFSAENKEYVSVVYQATDHIDEANEIYKPFFDARKETRVRELAFFEQNVTPEEKSDVAKVENHAPSLQEHQALNPVLRLFRPKPPRPTEEQVATWKRVTEKRTELTNRKANPLHDLEAVDGNALVRDLTLGWESKGFHVSKTEEKSNGEYRNKTIELTYGASPTV